MALTPQSDWTPFYRVGQAATLVSVIVFAIPLLLIGKAEFFADTPRHPQDLINGFSATFLLSAAIAALAFTMAQTLDPAKEERARRLVIQGGSYLFLGALWFLVAATMRYSLLYDRVSTELGLSRDSLGRILVMLGGPLSLVFYTAAGGASVIGLFNLFLGLFEKLFPGERLGKDT